MLVSELVSTPRVPNDEKDRDTAMASLPSARHRHSSSHHFSPSHSLFANRVPHRRCVSSLLRRQLLGRHYFVFRQ